MIYDDSHLSSDKQKALAALYYKHHKRMNSFPFSKLMKDAQRNLRLKRLLLDSIKANGYQTGDFQKMTGGLSKEIGYMPPNLKYVEYISPQGNHLTRMLPVDADLDVTYLQQYYLKIAEGKAAPKFIDFLVWAKDNEYLRMPTEQELARIERENL